MKIGLFSLNLSAVGLIPLLWSIISVVPAGAQQVTTLPAFAGFKTLYRFCLPYQDVFCQAGEYDGQNPSSGLTLDAAGNLYGTTSNGGSCCGEFAEGTIFQIDSNGGEGSLDVFFVGGGVYPVGGVVLDTAGNLYTTTLFGGNYGDPRCSALNSPPWGGCGTVFSQGGNAFYYFCSAPNCTDGAFPSGGLILDTAGNLYGMTSQGGSNFSANGGAGGGTVYKLDSAGQYSVLYSFCSATNCADGSSPIGNLIQDSVGNLYGVTSRGGNSGNGTVFKLDTAGHEKVLYSFCAVANCTDGASPNGIIRDNVGDFYGTTGGGGNSGSGIVFKLNRVGHETVLHSFCSAANCVDGSNPAAGVIQDSAGSLYGTTSFGGNYGGGAVFRLDKAGHETVLHSFCATVHCTDGANPYAPVVQDPAGYIYGTTTYGGKISQYDSGYGTVFKIATTLKVAGITLTANVNPALVDQPVVLSAEVSGQSETPTGVVTFKEGNTILGTATLREGMARLRITSAKGGTYGVSAQYAGDLYNLPANAPLKFVVNQRTTRTTLVSSLNPSTLGQLVTLTATVTSAGGPTPTGHVAFMNGSTLLRNAPVSDGVAQIEISTFPVGSSSITAIYEGDEANAESTSRVLNQVVN